MKSLSNETLSKYVPPSPNERPAKEPPDTNNPPKDDPAKSPSPGSEEPAPEKPIKEPPASFYSMNEEKNIYRFKIKK